MLTLIIFSGVLLLWTKFIFVQTSARNSVGINATWYALRHVRFHSIYPDGSICRTILATNARQYEVNIVMALSRSKRLILVTFSIKLLSNEV